MLVFITGRNRSNSQNFLFPFCNRAVDTIFEALSECAALHPDQDFMEGENNDNANGDYRELSEHGMVSTK